MQHSCIVHVYQTGFVSPSDPFLVERTEMRSTRRMDYPRGFLVPQAFSTDFVCQVGRSSRLAPMYCVVVGMKRC
jgi:hypothetical protein